MLGHHLRSLVATALCVSCCGALAACGGSRAYFPTESELQKEGVAFSPGPIRSHTLSTSSARSYLLKENGGNWTRVPTTNFLERFGYLNPVSPSPGGVAAALNLRNTPAWEITFGGMHLEPPLPQVPPNKSSQKDGVVPVWHDVTVFVNATSGKSLLEIWNHCAPCSPPYA